jgi:hypothetical protein
MTATTTPDNRGPSAREPTPNWRHRLPLQTLLIEVFCIVLGVLLALGVNQWREDRANRSRADQLLQSITQELQRNQELLERIHDSNCAVVDTLRQMVDAEPDPGAEDDDRELSYAPGLQLQSTAWQVARSTEAFGEIEYQMVFPLSELYAMQEIYLDLGWQLARAVMTASAMAAVQNVEIDDDSFNRQFVSHFELVLSVETSLVQRYPRVLEILDPIAGATE